MQFTDKMVDDFTKLMMEEIAAWARTSVRLPRPELLELHFVEPIACVRSSIGDIQGLVQLWNARRPLILNNECSLEPAMENA